MTWDVSVREGSKLSEQLGALFSDPNDCRGVENRDIFENSRHGIFG